MPHHEKDMMIPLHHMPGIVSCNFMADQTDSRASTLGGDTSTAGALIERPLGLFATQQHHIMELFQSPLSGGESIRAMINPPFHSHVPIRTVTPG